MPPLTRARAAQPGNVPTSLNAAYYAERASAGLIIAEATDISAAAKGYSLTPGVHTPAQIAGWRKVTDAVHAAGGRIFLQIWHCGRMSHPDLHGGARTVAPSEVAFPGQIWLAGALMAIPLTIPVVNLVVPILGAATFTHLFHRLAGTPAR